MDPVTIGLLAGAGLGLLKSQTTDKDQEKRDRALVSATQRYSPWTGLKAGAIHESDPLGSMMQGGVTGLQTGQGIQNENAQNELRKAYAAKLMQAPATTIPGNAEPTGVAPGWNGYYWDKNTTPLLKNNPWESLYS